jgi:hypothetical protein
VTAVYIESEPIAIGIMCDVYDTQPHASPGTGLRILSEKYTYIGIRRRQSLTLRFERTVFRIHASQNSAAEGDFAQMDDRLCLSLLINHSINVRNERIFNGISFSRKGLW